MNKIDSLIFDIKKELHSEPIVQEYFSLKKVLDKDKELSGLITQMKREQKIMCENINNDSIYLEAKNRYETLSKQINTNPLYQNYLIVRDEIIELLQEIKGELQ